jgi:hypothetical protein
MINKTSLLRTRGILGIAGLYHIDERDHKR